MPHAENDTAASATMDPSDPARGTLVSTAPLPNTSLLVDLGQQRRKRIDRLKRGEGALTWQIQEAVDRHRQELGISAEAEIVPVVLLYRRDEPDYVVTVSRPATKDRE
jgi:hypothetical protein